MQRNISTFLPGYTLQWSRTRTHSGQLHRLGCQQSQTPAIFVHDAHI